MEQINKILIIDDDLDICTLLKRFFRASGYNSSEFTDEIDALQALKEEKFDLAICDYKLRELDGQEMIDRIQKIQKIPVIIITGHSDVRTAVASIKQGAFDYIQKPIDTEELLRVVQNALASVDMSVENNNTMAPVGLFSNPPANLRASSINFEYELIIKTLDETNNNKTKAAKILNIDRKTLYNKIAQYEQEKKRTSPDNNK